MTTNEGGSDVTEMIEIKVRLLGTNIGVGISRCTAIVSASFMPSNQPVPLAAQTGPQSSRDKKKNDDIDVSEDNEILSKKGSSSSAALKRKRKAVNPKQAEDLDVDCMYELPSKPPLFDSETGEGERPTVSELSLPPFSFNNFMTSPALSNSNRADGTSPLTESSTENQTTSAVVPSAAPLKKKNGSAACEAINKMFWKTIETENYFQPFSRKTHRIDDLALKGGDYNVLCESKPSLYIPQWTADNGNHTINPPIHDSEDYDGEDVPILIELKGPSPRLLEGAGAVGPGSEIGSGSGSSSAVMTDGDQVNLCAPTLRNCTTDHPNINMDINMNMDMKMNSDFLYQRIVASFVLTCPHTEERSAERSSTGIPKESSEVPKPEPASRSSSSPSVSSISTTLYSDATTVETAMTTQDSSSSSSSSSCSSSISKREIDCSGSIEDKSSNSSIHTEMEPEPEPEPESIDSELHTDIAGSLGMSTDYINAENISSFHENGFEERATSNGICNSSRTEPELNSTLNAFCCEHQSTSDSMCSEGHEKCNTLFSLTRAQRTMIELAEVGLIFPCDCDETVLKEAIEGDLRSHFYDGDDSDVHTSPRELSYVTKDWSELPMRLERDRVDDDICITIRYMVQDLREEELRINDKLAALRKILEDPLVAQEAEAKRRSGDASRLLIARWQKLRKKGKTVVKTNQKSR